MLTRRKSKIVKIGNLAIGGANSIAIQSMLNTSPYDIKASIEQAKQLKDAGCDIIRIAVPDLKSVQLIGKLKENVACPIVADIHFDYNLALESINAGVDKIRINPGNIGSDDKVKIVANAANNASIPIRIGVNSGSLEKDILAKYGKVTAEALCDSALYHANLLLKHDFNNIVLSLKSSNVQMMTKAYKLIAEQCEFPLHLGVTEAGTEHMGIVKSSIGIGSLLLIGIGDTIRVSLTADPVKEIYAAKDILSSLNIKNDGIDFVSCPTCGRTKINLIELAEKIESELKHCKKNIKVAVMGCVVNGPGEAKEADIGIAGGDGCAVLFKKGQVIRKINEENIVSELISEIEKL